MNAPIKDAVFTVGMRVKINYKEGKNYGKLGTIREVVGPCADVALDEGPTIGYRMANLLPVEAPAPIAEPSENPMTCELRVGDLVEVVYSPCSYTGMQGRMTSIGKSAYAVRLDGPVQLSGPFVNRSSLKLISRAGAPVQATPVQHSPAKPEPALKKDEFSERGVLPSDVQGINEMVKRMFKDKRDETKPAPIKPTSHAGLLITASEKYLGLGFNDERGAP